MMELPGEVAAAGTSDSRAGHPHHVRRLVRVIGLLFIAVFVLALFAPRAWAHNHQLDYLDLAGTAEMSASHPSWMAWIPDSVRLNELSIPGTHDSMAYDHQHKDVEVAAQTQKLDLSEQLHAGIRYLDIRIHCPNADCRQLKLFHGIIDLEHHFVEDVLAPVKKFLTAHPTETIIMRVANEGTEPADFCSAVRDALEGPVHDEAQTRFPPLDLWRPPAEEPKGAIQYPRIGEVRGKVVVSDNIPCSNFLQHHYTTLGLAHKAMDSVRSSDVLPGSYNVSDLFEDVRDFAVQTDGIFYRNRFRINSLAGSGKGIFPIDIAAGEAIGWSWRGMNDLLHAFLDQGGVKDHIGVMAMDFPGRALISMIIALNFDLRLDHRGLGPVWTDANELWSNIQGSNQTADATAHLQEKVSYLRRVLSVPSAAPYWHAFTARGNRGPDWGYAVDHRWATAPGAAHLQICSSNEPRLLATACYEAKRENELMGVIFNGRTRPNPLLLEELTTVAIASDAKAVQLSSQMLASLLGLTGDAQARALGLYERLVAKDPLMRWYVVATPADRNSEHVGIDVESDSFLAETDRVWDGYRYTIWATNPTPPTITGLPNPARIELDEGSSIIAAQPTVRDHEGDGSTTLARIIGQPEAQTTVVTTAGDLTGSVSWPLTAHLHGGNYTLRIETTDGRAGNVADIALVIRNVPPWFTLDAVPSPKEGSDFQLSGTVGDFGGTQGVSVEVAWGDGSGATTGVIEGGRWRSSHVFRDDGTYPVTVTVTDEDGAQVVQTTTVTVTNVAPIVSLSVPEPVDEGSSWRLGVSWTDPGDDTHTIEIDWGDESPIAQPKPNGGSVSREHIYGKDGIYPVIVRVADEDGGSSTEHALATIRNAAPRITELTVTGADGRPTEQILEGESISISAAFTDAGLWDAFTTEVEWDDSGYLGSTIGTVEPLRVHGNKGTVRGSQAYGDNGTYVVRVVVRDGDGGEARQSFELTVGNVDPTASIHLSRATMMGSTPTILGEAGRPVDLEGRATDPGSDDLTFTWRFADGTAPVEYVSLANPAGGDPYRSPTIAARAVSAQVTHPFAEPCVYEPVLTVTDDDAGASIGQRVHVVVTGTADKPEARGWWHKQYRSDGAESAFQKGTLECYLTIARHGSAVFDEHRPLRTIKDADNVFRPRLALPSARDDLDRELLAAWLNLANGGLDYDQLVHDADGDGSNDQRLAQVIERAERTRLDPVATDTQLKDQTRILRKINRSAEEFPGGLLPEIESPMAAEQPRTAGLREGLPETGRNEATVVGAGRM